jgi:hypothetical protein
MRSPRNEGHVRGELVTPTGKAASVLAILVRVARLLGDLTEISLPPRLAGECLAILKLIANRRQNPSSERTD